MSRICLIIFVLGGSVLGADPVDKDAKPDSGAQPRAVALDKPALTSVRQKMSYSFGMRIGSDIQRTVSQMGNLDRALVAEGIADMLLSRKTRLTPQEAQAALTSLQQHMDVQRKAVGAKNKVDGEAFLAANAQKDRVKTTKSGLQYRVLRSGDGRSPSANDTVVTHYKGNMIDGTVFDSSYRRGEPATFRVTGVIKGWTEALQLMHVGDKWQLVIPADLAYGTSGKGAIPPNTVLIFELELLDIK